MLLTLWSRTTPIDAEAVSVAAEQNCLRIARKYGEPTLPTKAPVWENVFSSASPLGALTPTVARETLTRKALARARDRQRKLRTPTALLALIAPRPLRRGVVVSAA